MHAAVLMKPESGLRRFETQTEIAYYTRVEEVNARASICLREQRSPFDELLHVPLLICVPGEPAISRRVSSLVRLIDPVIDPAPAIVDLPDIEPADDRQGISLVPLLLGEADGVREGVFSKYDVRGEEGRWPVISYRTEDWKLIYGGGSCNHQFCDLQHDPDEQSNAYHTAPPVLSHLTELL